MKMLSLFSGIGAIEKAMKNKGIAYELVNFCEIDKHAELSYCALFGEDKNKNLGDISKVVISDIEEFNFVSWGFPCTDISIQNPKGKGLKGETSGLYTFGKDILAYHKPKFSLIENVAYLAKKNNGEDLKLILKDLDEAGYNSYYKVLNALDYDLPQNRDRIFIISIRKDIDPKSFKFKVGKRTEKIVKDILDDQNRNRHLKASLVPFLDSKYHKDYTSAKGLKKVFDGNSQGYFTTDFGGKRIYSIYGTAGTLTTKTDQHNFLEIESGLNALERLRLQGFDDSDYDKLVEAGISEAQIKKQAGRSIAVNVVESFIEEIFKEATL